MAEPLVVVWRLTERCDLGCQFCGYSRELTRSRQATPAALVLAFGAALGQYAARAGREILLSWLGGEPLLWPALRDVGPALRAHGLRLGVTTNGARLAGPWAAHLAEHYAQVTVSVDGLADWHDHVRAAPGLFNRIAAGLQRLAAERARRGAGPRLRVNVVLMRSNLEQFEPLCLALAGWGVDEVTFNLLGGLERGGPFYERERLSPELWAAWRGRLPEVRAHLAGRGLTVRGDDRYLERLAAQARAEVWPVDECGPGQRFLFVDERGRAGPCSFTASGLGVPVSELTDGAALAELPARLQVRRAAARPAACADCRSTQVFGKFDAA